MIAGANVATIIIMFLVGYSDYLNPMNHPMLSNLGLLFPVFLVINLGFLFFWLLFKLRYALIPFLGFVVCYVPVRKYIPLNMSDEAPKGAIKVLSYNVWNYGDDEMEEGEINPVIDYIRKQDADIVCLQEAMPNSDSKVAQIDSILKPMYPYYDMTCHPNGGDCLVVFSKYPIRSKEQIKYESRGNLSVAYRLEINKREVLLINNHLETTGLSLEERAQFKKMLKGKLRTGTAEQTSKTLVAKLGEATKKRAPEAEAVAAYVKQHRGMSIILCGDFNDGPISYAHRIIADKLVDCYVESGNGPGISYHRSGFFVRIDNIMCSKDWSPYGCKVDDKISNSDHYPIICWLKSTRNLKK